jgi:hypothetical protein
MAIPHYQPAQGRDFKQEFYFMADEVVTDFEKAKATLKADMEALGADVAKVKSFWTDYRLYFVAVLCLIIGAILGHKL